MIEEGTFTIFDNSGRELARVSKGSCFGELALLHQVNLWGGRMDFIALHATCDATQLHAQVPSWRKALLGVSSGYNRQTQRHKRACGSQDVRAANVKALTDGALLALHRDDFNAMLGSLTHIRHMWRFEALRKVCIHIHSCSLCVPSTSATPR